MNSAMENQKCCLHSVFANLFLFSLVQNRVSFCFVRQVLSKKRNISTLQFHRWSNSCWKNIPERKENTDKSAKQRSSWYCFRFWNGVSNSRRIGLLPKRFLSQTFLQSKLLFSLPTRDLTILSSSSQCIIALEDNMRFTFFIWNCDKNSKLHVCGNHPFRCMPEEQNQFVQRNLLCTFVSKLAQIWAIMFCFVSLIPLHSFSGTTYHRGKSRFPLWTVIIMAHTTTCLHGRAPLICHCQIACHVLAHLAQQLWEWSVWKRA